MLLPRFAPQSRRAWALWYVTMVLLYLAPFLLGR